MSRINEIKACLRLMKEAECATLATVDSDCRPKIRTVFNLRRATQFPALAEMFEDQDLSLMIYVTTNTSSHKVSEIRTNSAVSIHYCIPATFKGITLCGDMEEVTDTTLKQSLWQDGWEMYYPEGPDDPDYTVLRLLPDSAFGWLAGRPFHLVIGDEA